MKKITFLLMALLWAAAASMAQYTPLSYALFNLDQNNQTVSRGWGDIGVVAQGYDYQTAFHQNPALLARGKHLADFSLSYMPIANTLNTYARTYSFAGFHTFDDGRQAIGLANRLFSLGELTYPTGGGTAVFRPFDNYFGVSYAYALSDNFSLGATAKYLISLQVPPDFGGTEHSFAFDFGLNYRNTREITDGSYFHWEIGAALTNLGPKISYSEFIIPTFIPTGAKFGVSLGWKFVADANTSFTVLGAYQAEKLLIPTPQVSDDNNNGLADWLETPVLSALFSSWSDAPNGAAEEWAEVTHRLGVEVRLDMEHMEGFIAFRGGMVEQNELKGQQSALCFGGSINYRGVYFDIAHLQYQSAANAVLNPPLSLGLGYQIRLK